MSAEHEPVASVEEVNAWFDGEDWPDPVCERDRCYHTGKRECLKLGKDEHIPGRGFPCPFRRGNQQ